jgi:hypothetical protein
VASDVGFVVVVVVVVSIAHVVMGADNNDRPCCPCCCNPSASAGKGEEAEAIVEDVYEYERLWKKGGGQGVKGNDGEDDALLHDVGMKGVASVMLSEDDDRVDTIASPPSVLSILLVSGSVAVAPAVVGIGQGGK